MSSTTRQPVPEPTEPATEREEREEQDANGAESVDRVLAQLAGADASQVAVELLSDLTRAGAFHLRDRWQSIPVAARTALVQAMADSAEADVQHNFDRALLVALDDDVADTRLVAVEALWELESSAFLELLLDRVEQEPDERVRAAQVMALGRYALLAALGELDDDAADSVRETLLSLHQGDPSLEVRRRSLESVACFSADDEVAELIEQAWESSNHQLQVSALHAMGRQADGRWLETVHEQLSSDEPELRFEAAAAAGMIGDERSIAHLVEALADDDGEVRLAAIAAIGAIGGTMAVNTLRRLVNDEAPAIAEAAEVALEEAMLYANPLRPLL